MKTPFQNLSFGLRPDEVVEALGSRQLYREMLAAKWLVPVVKRHKLTLFDRGDVAKAWARILSGQSPVKTTADSAS